MTSMQALSQISHSHINCLRDYDKVIVVDVYGRSKNRCATSGSHFIRFAVHTDSRRSILYQSPRAGSGVVRIDPLRFLAGCRKKRLKQAPSVLSFSLGFL